MNRIAFFRESLKNIRTIGTITRSSKYLCKSMVGQIEYKKGQVIVELGAGDGVITRHILKNMKEDSILISFEVNKLFCEKIRSTIKDDRLVVVEDSAEKLGEYLKKQNVEYADIVISAIPFVSLPDELGLSIITACKKYMKLGGRFVQVHYSMLAKKFYPKIFGNVNISFVPLNIPPAFVFVCEKRQEA